MLKQKSQASVRILFLLFTFALASNALLAQGSGDPAITQLSVLGVVTTMNSDTHEVLVTTAAGSKVTVTLGSNTVFMRIPPGEKTKDKFIKITANDFGVGDSVFARGRMSEDRKSMPALEFYVRAKVKSPTSVIVNEMPGARAESPEPSPRSRRKPTKSPSTRAPPRDPNRS